ncbi:MAG: sugar nucleotide-binding protein [SAR324 cluster bacterium]|uniref:dTDP-4-dehydrorhamnose reductase n=1 Tax=SAR324 cluster bacterium TaxID=2024889 RepID=A0A7X9FQN5_9DELT|nr:sugar nucleotide-binding protein [SAR324 cluster bacterium]
MKKTDVLVLGGTGMLGSMIVDFLTRCEELHVFATAQNVGSAAAHSKKIKNIEWKPLSIGDEDKTVQQLNALQKVSWIINAIGIIKPYIHDENPIEVETAIRGNSLFPYLLTKMAIQNSAKIIQIATDCVYSGSKGNYIESDKHDALDVYGKTKSLGEVCNPSVMNLRCSIIGPEHKNYLSLYEWFRKQPIDSTLSGFINHEWNGVTTLQFAKLCKGIITAGIDVPNLQHIVPEGRISKYELLKCFAENLGRRDLTIKSTEASTKIDRTLSTSNEALNQKLWELAGYVKRPPTVPEMVSELAEFDYRFTEA